MAKIIIQRSSIHMATQDNSDLTMQNVMMMNMVQEIPENLPTPSFPESSCKLSFHRSCSRMQSKNKSSSYNQSHGMQYISNKTICRTS